ncbi:MAG: hypothetical protein ACI3XH_06100, partial [Phascolarctobacterium sp.]
MKIKKYIAGFLAAAMLTSFASLAQAASFTTSMQLGPFFLKEDIGYDETFQSYNAALGLSKDLAARAVESYVVPYFQKKGIQLSREQADAIAFGAMEISDYKSVLEPGGVVVSGTGTIVDESKMEAVFANKRYMDGYILTVRYIHKLDIDLVEPEMHYKQNPNDDTASEVQRVLCRYWYPYFKLIFMQNYWKNQDFTLTVTQEAAKITETPNNEDPNCLV